MLIGVVAGEAHVRSGIPGEFQFQTIAVLVAGVLSSVAGGRIGIRDPADYVLHLVAEQAKPRLQVGLRLP